TCSAQAAAAARVPGVYYGEPNASPGWQGYTMGAVNNTGQLTEALQEF
ncbi:arabinogalactan endo-1,4-beta-galactosidase, partial [Xanthomonas perforans]